MPLRASETVDSQGQYGQPESCEELFCAGAIAFPPASRPLAETLDWHNLGLMHSGGPYAFKDKPYKTAEVYQYNDGDDVGIELIFEQHVSGHSRIWHINPDLIVALGLIQEGDVWVRPEEGYVDVVRQRRDKSGKVVAIEKFEVSPCAITLPLGVSHLESLITADEWRFCEKSLSLIGHPSA